MRRQPLLVLALLVLSMLACVRGQPDVIVITATFPPAPGQTETAPTLALPTLIPDNALIVPTADPPRALPASSGGQDYIVQAGDSLSGIAQSNGVSLEALLAANPDLFDPNLLAVGQIIKLPAPPSDTTPAFKIVPDARMVTAPGSRIFDLEGFVASQRGFVTVAADIVNGQFLTAGEIVRRVALEYSVDARLLLALLEYRAGWLSNPTPSDDLKTYPMGAPASPLGFDRSGLYRQLTWAADQLNAGYYGWKGRGWTALDFEDGTRLLYSPGLNAGTVAVQYMLAQYNTYARWQQDVSPRGLYRTYLMYFGDPFNGALEPLVPPNLTQPELVFPFPSGQTWYFTGGPHGGWGSGSAWAAIDFAPPDDITNVTSSCFLSKYYATAVAPGVIARTGDGLVVLDLDSDGDETTGWSILYLHIAAQDRVVQGTVVKAGDLIGRPSCEGGFSNGTHIHIARRYNGEWIPASCEACPPGQERPSLVMSGWTLVGLPGQEYQGYMVKGGDQRVAEQGRQVLTNHVAW